MSGGKDTKSAAATTTTTASTAADTKIPDGLNSLLTTNEKSSAADIKIHPSVKPIETQLVAWRRYLHAHPELSFQEVETAKWIAAQLNSISTNTGAGLVVVEKVGKTGVVALLKGTGPALKTPYCIARM